MRPAALLLAGALLLLGGAAAGWWYLQRYMHTPGPLAREAVVYLPRGSGLGEITSRLAAARVIDHPWLLRIALRLSGRDRRLRAGEYRFTPGMTPAEVVERIERGLVLLHRLTIPEGLTVAQVYARIAAAEFLAGELPKRPPEGSLLPETYLFPRDAPRRVVVAEMKAAMAKTLAAAWRARDPALPLAGPEELLILASIVEKETSREDEYPLIAAVFVNRLRRGMPLQADPTVIYALTRGEGPLGRRLTRRDLEIDSPYNTYRHPGLPPTPIANPGKAALFATADPADVDHLYFVADGTGGHRFARTLEEHIRNVRNWRRVRDGLGGHIPLPVPRPERTQP